MSQPHFLQPLLKTSPAAGLALRVDGRPVLVATTLEGAFDSTARRRGLLGRDALPVGTALIIAPCSGVHTFGMRFPIDVVFVARDGEVLKILSAMPPRRVGVALRAFAAIELAAGSVGRSGLHVGDTLTVR